MTLSLINPLFSQPDSIIHNDTVAVATDPDAGQSASSDTVAGEAVTTETEKTMVTLGQNEVLIVEENGDTTRVKLGKRGISIVEGEDGTTISIIEMDEETEEESITEPDKRKFKPHFSGIDLGLNNYLTPDYNFNLPSDQQFMDLNTARSWNLSLNFIDYGFGFGTDKVGLATGMGLEFSWYAFNNQNSITKDTDGFIVSYEPDYAENLTHSRFFTSYLTVPLLLEVQIPAGKNRIHLSAGVIGGAKLWSNTRMKYRTPGTKAKNRIFGDYNLSPFRYGATARIGYGGINLYANYYLTSLFKQDRGPELYPVALGLSFTW